MHVEFTNSGDRFYGDIGMRHDGILTVKHGIHLMPKAIEQARSILTQCMVDGVLKGVMTIEAEMVDKTLAVYKIEGATGDNGKDYY